MRRGAQRPQGLGPVGPQGPPVASEKRRDFDQMFILIFRFVKALQLVVEEYIMKHVDFIPMQIIGWEGVCGGRPVFQH